MKKAIIASALSLALAFGLSVGVTSPAHAGFEPAPKDWGSVSGSIVNAASLASVAGSLKVSVTIDCGVSFGGVETISSDAEQIARWNGYFQECSTNPKNYGKYGGGETVLSGGATSWSFPGLKAFDEVFVTPLGPSRKSFSYGIAVTWNVAPEDALGGVSVSAIGQGCKPVKVGKPCLMNFSYDSEKADVRINGLVKGSSEPGTGMSVAFRHWVAGKGAWEGGPCESSGPYPGLRIKTGGIDFVKENVLGAEIYPCKFKEGDTYSIVIRDPYGENGVYDQWLGGLSLGIVGWGENNSNPNKVLTPDTPGLITFKAGSNDTLSPNAFNLKYRPTVTGHLKPVPADYKNVKISARALWLPSNHYNYPNDQINFEATGAVNIDSEGNFVIASELRPGYQYTLMATYSTSNAETSAVVFLGNFMVPLPTDGEDAVSNYVAWMDAIRAHPRLQSFVAPDGDGLIDDIEFAVPAGFGGAGSGVDPAAEPPSYDPIIIGADGSYVTAGATVSVSEPPASDWQVSYQWFRDGIVIANANGRSYQVGVGDAGHNLMVKVTFRKSGYLDVVKTSTQIGVRELPPAARATSPVKISGAVQMGKKLTAAPVVWDVKGAVVKYEWLVGGKVVATGMSYTPRAADCGQKIVLRVTASRPGYAPVSVSKATKALPKLASSVTFKVATLRAGKSGSAMVSLSAKGFKPTGKVMVYNSKKVLGSAVLKAGNKGKVKVKLAVLKKGKYVLSVKYAGCVQVKGSVSKQVKVRVR